MTASEPGLVVHRPYPDICFVNVMGYRLNMCFALQIKFYSLEFIGDVVQALLFLLSSKEVICSSNLTR